VEEKPSKACSATPFSPTVSSLSTYHNCQLARGINPARAFGAEKPKNIVNTAKIRMLLIFIP
jgi:hypothetical protein